MPMNLDNLGGFLGAEVLKETREFEDTWNLPGLKVTGVVLRGDHPEWRQHLMDLQQQRPEQKRTRRLVNERIFSGLAPKGFKQSKKLSEGEAHERMIGKLAEEERLVVDTFSLREQKPGIASILCKRLEVNGETLVKRNGKELDLTTPEGREAFMDHEMWLTPEGELSIPVYQKGPDGEPLLDEFQEPIPLDHGGKNLGDAIAALLVEQAEDLAKFVEKRRAEALDLSGAASNGPTESGSVVHLQNDD